MQAKSSAGIVVLQAEPPPSATHVQTSREFLDLSCSLAHPQPCSHLWSEPRWPKYLGWVTHGLWPDPDLAAVTVKISCTTSPSNSSFQINDSLRQALNQDQPLCVGKVGRTGEEPEH